MVLVLLSGARGGDGDVPEWVTRGFLRRRNSCTLSNFGSTAERAEGPWRGTVCVVRTRPCRTTMDLVAVPRGEVLLLDNMAKCGNLVHQSELEGNKILKIQVPLAGKMMTVAVRSCYRLQHRCGSFLFPKIATCWHYCGR